MSFFYLKNLKTSDPKKIYTLLGNLLEEYGLPEINPRDIPIPLQHLVIKKKYYQTLKKDLECFVRIMRHILPKIIDDPYLIDQLYLTKEEKEFLPLLPRGKFQCPFLRLDCALIESGAKILEINARHPFGPGSFCIVQDFKNQTTDNPNNYLQFSLEEKIGQKLLALLKKSGHKGLITLIYLPELINEVEIQELYGLTKYFNALGIKSNVIRLDDIKYKNQSLIYKQNKTGLVYSWVEAHRARSVSLIPLLQSLKENKVAMVNDFSSIIVGNKNFLPLLQDEKLTNLLTSDQLEVINRLLPRTICLNKKNISQLTKEKNKFVLKSGHGTEGREIFIGKNLSQQDWTNHLFNYIDQGWVAQEFVLLPKISLDYLNQGLVKSQEVYFDFDPYFVDSTINGFISRASENHITNFVSGGLNCSVLIEK